MKRNLNKAFTLIELLAVIVILAIIALIATPIILGIVEDARKDSFERSVELVISTTDLDVASKNIQDGYTYEITDGTIPNLEIGIKNIEGMNGTIVYDKEGKEQYAIHNEQYCVMKTEGMSKAVISEYEEGSCKLSIVTSSKYFTYKEIEIEPTYEIIDKEVCQTYFVRYGYASEEATIICNNEPFDSFEGMTLTETLSTGELAPTFYPELLIARAISYTGPEYEYEIIDKEQCIKSFANMPSEMGTPDDICNNEPIESLSGMTLTEYFSSGFVLSQTINQYIADGIIRVTNAPLEITSYSEEGPKNVVIPSTIDGNTVVSIGDYAFTSKNLTSVSIPDTITSIGQYAFANNNLTQANKNEIIQINPSAILESTDASCFTYEEVSGGVSITGYKCADTDVIIPSTINNKNVVKIGSFAFQGYQYNSDVSYLSKSIVRPVNYEFTVGIARGIITSVILPDTVTYIDNNAFYHNQITNVYLSKNLEYIGEVAFEDNQITTLTIPDSLTYIGQYAFRENQITTIELSNNNHLETIEIGAFANNLISETSDAYQKISSINPSAFQL